MTTASAGRGHGRDAGRTGFLNAEGLVRFPGHLSFEEAATLPCAAVTAWHALFRSGGLRPGETCCCRARAAFRSFLQFAKMAGARVIATSSSEQEERLQDGRRRRGEL